MRRLAATLPFLFLLSLAGVRADTPPLLQDAITRLIAENDHWAYTVTIQRLDKNGHPTGGLVVERYDPSQPYDHEWTLITYDGHGPSASETLTWQGQKRKEMKRKEERPYVDMLDLDNARYEGENAKETTFYVPLEKDAVHRVPADMIEVFMSVDKVRHTLMGFSMRPKQPFRVAGLFKVESGELDARFDVVQADHPPALVWVRGSGTGRVLGFFRMGMGRELTYADFKRVKPYADHFAVKIGDVKALNF